MVASSDEQEITVEKFDPVRGSSLSKINFSFDNRQKNGFTPDFFMSKNDPQSTIWFDDGFVVNYLDEDGFISIKRIETNMQKVSY